jgi:hypothetical protein
LANHESKSKILSDYVLVFAGVSETFGLILRSCLNEGWDLCNSFTCGRGRLSSVSSLLTATYELMVIKINKILSLDIRVSETDCENS